MKDEILEREPLDEKEYILYGAYLAINRCSKIIRDCPDSGYNSSIIKEFESLKSKLEKEIYGRA